MRMLQFYLALIVLILGPACHVDLDSDDLEDDADDDQDWLDQDEPDWDEGPPEIVYTSLDNCTDSAEPCTDGDVVLIEARVDDPDGWDDVTAVEFRGPYALGRLVADPHEQGHWFVNYTLEGIERDGAHEALFVALDDIGRFAVAEVTLYLTPPEEIEER